jgi:hypothetical protein
MVNFVAGLVLCEPLGELVVELGLRLADLLLVRLEVPAVTAGLGRGCGIVGPTQHAHGPEGVQEGLVQKEVDVFGVVICLVRSMDLLLGLPWVDTFQDA